MVLKVSREVDFSTIIIPLFKTSKRSLFSFSGSEVRGGDARVICRVLLKVCVRRDQI